MACDLSVLLTNKLETFFETQCSYILTYAETKNSNEIRDNYSSRCNTSNLMKLGFLLLCARRDACEAGGLRPDNIAVKDV